MGENSTNGALRLLWDVIRYGDVDANTGYPMVWLYTADASHRGAWHVLPGEPEWAGETIGEVYNEDEEAWEREMNEELAQYGLALGDEDKQLAAYWLEEL